MECLLGSGAPLELAGPKGGTALSVASEMGRHQCTEMLLKAGARVDHVDSDGATPLHLGAHRNTAAARDHTGCDGCSGGSGGNIAAARDGRSACPPPALRRAHRPSHPTLLLSLPPIRPSHPAFQPAKPETPHPCPHHPSPHHPSQPHPCPHHPSPPHPSPPHPSPAHPSQPHPRPHHPLGLQPARVSLECRPWLWQLAWRATCAASCTCSWRGPLSNWRQTGARRSTSRVRAATSSE